MRTIALIASIAALAAPGAHAAGQAVDYGYGQAGANQAAYGQPAYGQPARGSADPAQRFSASNRPMDGPFNPAPSTAQAAGLRLLSWPGKVEHPADQAPDQPRSWSAQTPRFTDYRPLPVEAPRRIYQPAPSPTQSPAPAVRAAPTEAVQSRPLAPPAPPTSIYAPPPPRTQTYAPSPQVQARAAPQPAAAPRPAQGVRALAQAEPVGSDYLRPRFYSVHRPYGQEPDPITLTPEFLSQGSPDLATPPPPVPRATVNGAGNVVRPAPPPPDPMN